MLKNVANQSRFHVVASVLFGLLVIATIHNQGREQNSTKRSAGSDGGTLTQPSAPDALDRATFANIQFMLAQGDNWAKQHAPTYSLFEIIDTNKDGRVDINELRIAEQDFNSMEIATSATGSTAVTSTAGSPTITVQPLQPATVQPTLSSSPVSAPVPPAPVPPAPVPPASPPPAPAPLAPLPATKERCFSSITDATQVYSAPQGCRKFVALVCPVTTRKTGFHSVTQTAYAKSLLPSVVETLARSDDNKDFDVAFYIGFDAGDPVWDKSNAVPDLLGVVRSIISSKYAVHADAYRRKSGKELPGLKVKAVKCKSDSMVAASNCVIGKLFEDGAEYWYRVNDDTTFVTPNWIRDFTNVLAAFDPPNLGAVGPTCKQGNTAIMTYDFVHRTHWIVHNFQYPRVLKNWWCDDWITNTYGKARTLKLPHQEVKHEVTITRYKVYAGDKQGRSVPKDLLPIEYRASACLIDDWLKNNGFADKPKTHNGKGKAACRKQ